MNFDAVGEKAKENPKKNLVARAIGQSTNTFVVDISNVQIYFENCCLARPHHWKDTTAYTAIDRAMQDNAFLRLKRPE